MKLNHAVTLGFACVMLAACGTKAIKPSDKHIQQTPDTVKQGSGVIPQTSKNAVVLPPPAPAKKIETYSVVVTNLPAKDILFALARDAKINIDIHPGLAGEVTINAINQTLPQILDRISKQVEMRYELNDNNLVVMPDSPFLKNYKIDYVNMSRDADGSISNTGQLGGSTTGGATGNNSKLSITNVSKNHFWDTLVKNVTDILRETDKILPEGSSETVVEQSTTNSTTGTVAQNKKSSSSKSGIDGSPNAATIEGEGTTVTRRNTFREAASVIPNPETGIITVRATGRQHEKIQEFITQVMRSAQRQVMIEMTVAQVTLTDEYQQGINWAKLIDPGKTGLSIGQALATQILPTNGSSGALILNYEKTSSASSSLTGSVSLLNKFGDVKVLSSPKLSVMNNQTALLRVVENFVYFTIKADTTANQTTTTTNYTTTPNTIPIGFSMSITPQISDTDMVLLNVRPSITRWEKDVPDPNPDLKKLNIVSNIPQTSTREMESVLKIGSNQIAVMGGLMEDRLNNTSSGIPGISDIPFAGNLFKNRTDLTQKTELVIFLRPIVIKEASINGDYHEFRNSLPDSNFLKSEAEKASQ